LHDVVTFTLSKQTEEVEDEEASEDDEDEEGSKEDDEQQYIQRWSIIKNSAVDVSDERAIDAFTLGLRRGGLVEEMGRIKPRTISDLMDITNRFADGEDACNNKRTRSSEDDRETDTTVKGEDLATTTITVLIVK
jgi:hypothetical protein